MERGFNYSKKPCASEEGRGYNPGLNWFEHDLFCQINLIYLPDLLNGASVRRWVIDLRATRDAKGTARLSLIQSMDYPGHWLPGVESYG